MSVEHRAEYIARINRVIDHIERHLDEPLSLERLAQVACFSPWHFHRVFNAMVGETLNRFVRRLRVERAASLLVARTDLTVTDIALQCGFSSSATFARAFKEAFGVSATQWRAAGTCIEPATESKIRKPLNNLGKAAIEFRSYIHDSTSRLTWIPEEEVMLNTTIDVQELPARHVAYVRHTGPYGQPEVMPGLVGQITGWVAARGLLNDDSLMICVAHDDPGVTEADKLRLSVCRTVPEGTRGEGEVGVMDIPGGQYAVGHFEIPPHRIGEAWGLIMGHWLPQSGYQPDDRLCYEIARNDPRNHPEGLISLDICVPVRPL